MSSQAKLFLTFLIAAGVFTVVFVEFVPQSADVLFVNGKFYTMDSGNNVAEAIALKGDRILGVGSRSTIERKFKSKEVINLNGKTVLPGLIDAHVHLMSLGIARMTVDLVGARSEQDAINRVKDRVSRVHPGQWIRGRGWDQNDWPSRQFPSHVSLDRVSPNNPVYLTRVDGHACWVNKKALEISGVGENTPDPSGGRIIRDTQGIPTGVFIDRATALVSGNLPPISEAEEIEALRLAVQECLSYGITSVHDMGVDAKEIQLYKRLIDTDQFPFRVYAVIGGAGEAWEQYLGKSGSDVKKGTLIGYGGNKLTVRAVKLYIDGALGSRGAALIEPYNDEPTNRGLTVTSEENLRKTVDEALANGFQVCTHAIGDRGNHIALNVYEAALKAHPVADHRLRIEHAQVLHPDDIPRFKLLGVVPSMQPTHCTSDMYWAEARLGPSRIRGAYAWRSLLKTGVVIPGGSDFPVEHANPLYGIYAATTRQDKEGKPQSAKDVRKGFQLSQEGIADPSAFNGGWYASERMTIEEAVRSFTTWAAWGAFEEGLKGSLEKGKLADFIVLSTDIVNVNPKDIINTVVEMTVLGGKSVYRRGSGTHALLEN